MATNTINDLSLKPRRRPTRRIPEAPPLDLRGRHHEMQVEPSQHVINLAESEQPQAPQPTVARQHAQGRFFETVPASIDTVSPSDHIGMGDEHDYEPDWTDRLVDAEARVLERLDGLQTRAEQFRTTGEPWQIIVVGVIMAAFIMGIVYLAMQVLPAHASALR